MWTSVSFRMHSSTSRKVYIFHIYSSLENSSVCALDRFFGRIGTCAVCRSEFQIIRPLFLDNGNVNANHAENRRLEIVRPASSGAANVRRNEMRVEQLQHQQLRIIVLQGPNGVGLQANRHMRQRNIVRRQVIRRRNRRNRLQPYVRPVNRVRNRLRTARMNYNLLKCAVCGRTYQTNELPALSVNGNICSFDCFHRIQ